MERKIDKKNAKLRNELAERFKLSLPSIRNYEQNKFGRGELYKAMVEYHTKYPLGEKVGS